MMWLWSAAYESIMFFNHLGTYTILTRHLLGDTQPTLSGKLSVN